MSRGVDKIQFVGLAIVLVFHLNGVTFYGDTTLFLQIHVVEHLAFRNLYGIGEFQQTVGNSALTMVDMSNDTKVSYMLHLLFTF